MSTEVTIPLPEDDGADAAVASGLHRVQFYEDDAFLADAVARFLGAAVGGGDVAVLIATAAHRADVEDRLAHHGLDLARARQEGRWVALDAAATLAAISSDGRPDARRFADVVGTTIARAAEDGRRVRAFGEMVALLAAAGKHTAALRLEELWNELTARTPFSLLCGYPLAAFAHDAAGTHFVQVCDRHGGVIPAESFTRLQSEDARGRTIAELQQKARVLEAEVAQRKAAEERARESNRTFRALIEASPLPIVVIDPDATVRLWNAAAERVFGWPEAEVMGRPIPIVPPDKLAECAGLRDAVVRGLTYTSVETSWVRRDARALDVLISAAPLADDVGVVRSIVLLFEDVTARNRAEAARQRALRELTTLYQVGRTLSAELDLQRLFQAVTDAATQLSGAQFGVFFYNATDEHGGHSMLFTLSGAEKESFGALGMPRKTALLAPTFDGTGIIRLDDVRQDPRYGSNAPHAGMPPGHLPVTSYLAVPVVGRAGEVFGGLLLGHGQPAVFGDEAERVVAALAAQAAVAIDNARLYEAERRARNEAEATNRAKDEFLAMLGHELRNPLAAVRNAIVTAGLDASRRGRALEIARRGADQVGRLVDDLLDVARITQGRITLRRQRLPFASIVERAVESTRSLMEERGHELALALPDHALLVDGDATRLEQVVANLITNAAKYMDPGGCITVTAVEKGDEVVLRVRDHGIGIGREMLPRVFDLFAQADRALDRAAGGLGIGLTVVKRLVELHGGRVEARSEGLGQGAEFVVRLPAVPAARQESSAASSPERGAASPVRVLIVEDNPDAAESLMMLLEVLGHRVRIARDGTAALELARANVPDVMLMDIGLPGMDGYELARRVRAEPALCGVTLVALTGYGRDEDRQRAVGAGFDYHLVKPVNPDALQGLVERLPAPGRDEGSTLH